jgi:hypothetical protein
VQRRALGVLFLVLAAGLVLVAIFSALEGGRAWVIALAAAVLGLWLGDLGRRGLRRN